MVPRWLVRPAGVDPLEVRLPAVDYVEKATGQRVQRSARLIGRLSSRGAVPEKVINVLQVFAEQ